MLFKTHPSAAAAAAGVVILVLGLKRESCMRWLSYKYARLLFSPAACALVLSLIPPSEKKNCKWTVLMSKHKEGKMK